MKIIMLAHRSIYKYVAIASAAGVLCLLTLWCVSSFYAFIQPKILFGSFESHCLRKKVRYSSDESNVFVNWAEIRELPDGSWEPPVQVELDQLWFGFGFYAENGAWLRAGEVAVPFWFLLVIMVLPAAPYVASWRGRRHKRRSRFPIEYSEADRCRQNSE